MGFGTRAFIKAAGQTHEHLLPSQPAELSPGGPNFVELEPEAVNGQLMRGHQLPHLLNPLHCFSFVSGARVRAGLAFEICLPDPPDFFGVLVLPEQWAARQARSDIRADRWIEVVGNTDNDLSTKKSPKVILLDFLVLLHLHG